MTGRECSQYTEKEVRAVCTDGQIIEGYLSNIVSEFDSPSGKEEVDILIDDYCVSVPCVEIKSIQAKG